jgi:DNA-binding GntR family transcriptional regulator
MVVTYLRSRLLTGQISPGARMRESVLAPELGVSRATLREALRQLAHEGLLTYQIHAGMVVTMLTSADVVDIYTARRVLEMSAISAASERPLEFTALRECVDQHFAAAKRDDVSAIVATDMRFHHEIVALAASTRLGSNHEAILRQLRLGLNLLDRSKGDLETQAREHRRIMLHLTRGAFDEASQVLSEHLENAQEGLIKFLDQSAALLG